MRGRPTKDPYTRPAINTLEQLATEIATVDLGFLAFAADNAALYFLCHGFAELMQEDEFRLVRQAQVAAES